MQIGTLLGRYRPRTDAQPHVHQFLLSTEWGGAAEIAVRVASDLRKLGGINSTLWTPGTGRVTQQIDRQGLSFKLYDGAKALGRSRILAAASNASVLARLRRFSVGIAYAHSPLTYAALHHAFRLSGLKRIVHVHLTDDIDGLRRAFADPPDVIVTCARSLISQVCEALPADAKGNTRVVAIPNAVDTELFCPADSQTAKSVVGAPFDGPLILMLANLAPHKGQETMLRALAEIKRRGRPCYGWIAGADRSVSGAYQDHLKHLICDLGLSDRVRLLGFRTDVLQLLQAADAVLLPSTAEGLPLILLQAQACGVPVVAAPTAGIPEIIDDERTGFLVHAFDFIGYADRLERLFDDRACRKRIVNHARDQCITNHGWSNYIHQMSSLYCSLLALPHN